MTLEEEAKQVVQQGINSVPAERLNFLHRELIGGKPANWYCTTCPGKMRMVFYDLKLTFYTKNNTVMATKTRYSLKNTKGSFRPFGSGEVITAENLTDAKAEKLIKQNPAYANIFHIDESVAAPQLDDDTDEAPSEKEQLQARYQELSGEEPARSWTIAKLNEKIAEAEQAQ